MREPRNPFRLRASEYIESDATFVRLFGPGVLELFQGSVNVWDQVHILRSAPGGGKSSLMRLMTPSALLTLHAYRAREECKELYQRMRELRVLSDDGPKVLGALLPITKTYAALADMGLDPSRRTRLFFALLDARIILAGLQAASVLANLEYPADLVRFRLTENGVDVPGLKQPAGGMDLYQWARDVEARVCAAIDSLAPAQVEGLPGHETLWSLRLLAESSLRLDDQPLAAPHVLVMLDNVQDLTSEQREQLLKVAVETRNSVGVWISERFQALSTEELLSEGATQGRDYERVVPLERYWRAHSKRFEHILLNIADRRARAAADSEIDSFAACLRATLDDSEWAPVFISARDEVAERARGRAGSDERFRDWVSAREGLEGTPRELALSWRTLEILIERERRKSQQSFDFALSPEELSDKDDSGARAAAELFLAREYGLPYYFGPSRLATLSASNIEQFLTLAGDAFEEVISAALIKRAPELLPKRQEDIIRKAAERRWDEIPRRLRNGREVRKFLESVGEFAKWATYQPNAPYEAGVAGIAISMSDRAKLKAALTDQGDPNAAHLATILAAAISDNLLDPVLDYKCKGQRWMVLHLNRLLCVRFGLPLQYGGWREKTLKELYRWIEQGFKPPKKSETLL